MLAVLLWVVATIVWLEGGLKDHTTGEAPSFSGCLYFVVITITTVGYGDITPVTVTARYMDILLLTPVRLFAIFTLLGTAYQLVFKRFQESYRMKKATDKLNGHTIICGFSATGTSAARELLLEGISGENIVVIDTSTSALEEAAHLGLVAIEGDASREHVLQTVAIGRAAHAIVSTGRDDTNVLIALTVRDLNPKAHLIAVCHESENYKLLKRTGAETIVTPSVAGGKLVAAATRQPRLARTMTDLLSVGGRLRMDERPVRPDEIGKRVGELSNVTVVRIYRKDQIIDPPSFPPLEEGDIIICVRPSDALST